MSASRKETVTLKTFNSWPFKDEFKVINVDNEGYIELLQCVVCSKNIGQIRMEALRRRLKGAAIASIIRYVDGVNFIHKGNILRHIKSNGLHDWAKHKLFLTNSFSNTNTHTKPEDSEPATHDTDTSDSHVLSRSQENDQPRLDSLVNTTSRDAYTHLIRTALYIIRNEKSFLDFGPLIDLQRTNGAKFLQFAGKENPKACREFVKVLFDCMHDDVNEMLARANFFSGLMDGSQAHKTGAEKELIFTKIVVNGTPVELVLTCHEVSGSDANTVLAAFDGAFLHDCKLMPDRYSKLLVAVCTDGASVNMGSKSGACTQMKNDNRNWLLIIHCSNHKLELAMKDALQASPQFSDIDELMMNMYYHFRKSGKAKRIFKSVALSLGVTFVEIPKAHGTRFQNHKYRACKAMLINYLPLCLYCENMIELPGACKPEVAAKLKGYLNKFNTYTYLAALNFYRQVLKETCHISCVMQKTSSLITDIKDSITCAKDKLQCLASHEDDSPTQDLPFPAKTESDNTAIITAEATNLPASLAFREKHQLSEKQQRKLSKFTNVHKAEMKIKQVKQGQSAVKNIKEKLIPQILNEIDNRFPQFIDDNSNEIYESMRLSDHTTWDLTDKSYGVDDIRVLSSYFKEPLSFHNYCVDVAIFQFRELKDLARTKFKKITNRLQFWEKVFSSYSLKFPHILLLIELCLCIPWSSSTVERGFSTCRRIFNTRRTSLNKGTLNELMFLRINLPTLEKLDPDYTNSLVSKAVAKYLQKRRYSTKSKPLKGTIPTSGNKSVTDSTDGISVGFLPTPFNSPVHVNELLHPDIEEMDFDHEPELESESDTDQTDSNESDSDASVNDMMMSTTCSDSEMQTVQGDQSNCEISDVEMKPAESCNRHC